MTRAVLFLALLVPASGRASPQSAPASRPSAPAGVSSASPPTEARPAAKRTSGPNAALGIEEAVRLALRGRPRLRAAALGVAQAREAIRGARSGFFPKIRLDAAATFGPGGAHGSLRQLGLVGSPYTRNLGISVNVEQTIWDFGRTMHRWRARKSRVQVARAREAVARASVAFAVRLRFLECVMHLRRERVRESAVRSARLTYRQARILAEVRLRPRLDAELAKLRIRAAQVDVVRASHARLGCLLRLAREIGTAAPPARLVEPTGPVRPPAALGTLVERALAQRPELRTRRARLMVARDQVKAARSGHFPILRGYVSGGVARWNNSITGDAYASGGIILTVPVFEGFAVDAKVEAARLRLARLEAAKAEERLGVRGEVSAARQRLLGELEALRRARNEVQQAAQVARLARERYRARLVSLLDLQTAELAQTTAELRVAAAEIGARAARATLRYAVGG